MWQHTCSLESPEFKDTLLIARAKKGTEHTPDEHTIILHALKHEKAQFPASQPAPFMILPGIMKELTSMMQTWLMNEAACPPTVRQEPDNTLNLLDIDFWLWYRKVTPKGMACAFKIRFWEMFSIPGTYDILMDNQYKLPNSNDSCMRLRAPTACPKWNEGTEEDEKVLHWLSQNAGLTFECVAEVIKLFARRQSENAISGKTWNEAAKRAAVKHVSQPPPCPVKTVESTTVPSHGTFEQYTLLDRLSDAAKAQTRPSDDAMIIDEPAKPVAGSSKHPDDMDVINGELIY